MSHHLRRSFAAPLACLLFLCAAPILGAQEISRASKAGSAKIVAPVEPGHRSVLVIPPSAALPIVKKVNIGLDKSMMVELPVDVTNVLVSNPEVVDVVVQSSRRVYLVAKDAGEANAFLLDGNGKKALLLEISVQRDLSNLADIIQRLIPGSKISVETVGTNVVLTGSVVTPADANRAADIAGRFVKNKDGVVNLLSTAAKEQVLLKIQVAEIQRDALRRIGVDIPGSVLNSGNFTFSKIITNAFPVTSPSVPLGVAGSALQTAWTVGNHSVTTLLHALERSGMARTLAEPNLTALSGETAKFLAGGEFPIPIASQDRQITIQFKQFGVATSFKPVVLDQGRINLTISAEVSELSAEGAITVSDQLTVPALKVRRAETTLELPSGATLAMAGLLSDETRQNVDGVPGLKNLPVLGQLFRSNDYRRRETELVILVTPYLAKHMNAAQAARPDAGFAPASDLQSIFFGTLNRIYGRPGHVPEGSYQGDYGFIVEYPDVGVKG